MPTERWIASDQTTPPEQEQARSLRPQILDEYVGQRELVERLTIAIQASRERSEPVEHLLLHGPPGLGKTTLAHVVANEMGSTVHVTSGPAITKGADLVGALTRLEPNDVLFVDEIHRMPVAVEEFIYPAMEDGRIDVAIDAGLHGRTVRLAIKPFTLIGATTRAGLLSAPLRSRFGMVHHLRYYPDDDLERILSRSRDLLGVEAHQEALATIASRSRGTPRISNRLLRRVRDYAQVRAGGVITQPIVNEALALEGVDERGMDELDRLYMKAIGTTYAGGPVGLEAVAATLGEDSGTLEDVVEPYLLQIGLLARTRRGRQLTPEGARLVGVEPPADARDTELFDDDSA